MQNLPFVTNASFSVSCALLTQMIFEKTKNNNVSLRAHDRSGCVRRQIDAKEVNAKPSAWLLANTVFKRLDLPARARYCRFQHVLLRYSLEKAHLLKYLFLFGFVKTG